LQYEYPVDHLVRRFKFQGDLACGQLLAEVLAQLVLSRMRVSAEYRPDLVIPVPLHFLRRFKRGYNQAELLARILHQRCGIPIAHDRLQRVVNTKAQSGLDRKARRKNLQHAFTCKPVEAGHVALVDDVLTTGATLQECASVIKKAGARKVSVWVAARAAAPVNQH
jgi:ComF family protein